MFEIYKEKIGVMDKLISVIVPVYNVSQYLKQCVDSILNQSYKNLEIILVDDGSTDRSGLICDQYAQADGRVIVIHKENGGLSDARNAGLQVAKGEYIGFVDSDDFIHPDMYLILVRLLEENRADIAIANWQGFFDGKENEICDSRTGEITFFEDIETLKFLIFGKDKYRISFSVWDRLYRKKVIENHCFPKGKCYEDVVWSAKVFYGTKKSVYIDRDLYYYRRRDDSIVGADSKYKVSRRVITDEIPQIEAQIEFLKDIEQEKMADEETYFLYEVILKYYARCYYEKNDLQEELFQLITKYKGWARVYMHRTDDFSRKLVLLISLYAFRILIFLIYIKNRGKWANIK